MDLPTYTNIWRIEKRLYKLYDFRLPMPLPINWIAVFAGITIPYIVFLIAIGLPFNHTLIWLYVLPPGLITWLTTRPVIENKRLPELVESQVRYLTEPRTWVRFAPRTEKDQMIVTARVWHSRRPAAGQVATAGKPARVGQGQERKGAQAAPRTPRPASQPALVGERGVAASSERGVATSKPPRSKTSPLGLGGVPPTQPRTPRRVLPAFAMPEVAPAQKAPARKSSAQKAPAQKAPAQKAPAQLEQRPPAEAQPIDGMPVRARSGAPAASRLEMSHDGPGRRPVVVVPPAQPARPTPPANPVSAWPAPARPLRPVHQAPQETLRPEFAGPPEPVLPSQQVSAFSSEPLGPMGAPQSVPSSGSARLPEQAQPSESVSPSERVSPSEPMGVPESALPSESVSGFSSGPLGLPESVSPSGSARLPEQAQPSESVSPSEPALRSESVSVSSSESLGLPESASASESARLPEQTQSSGPMGVPQSASSTESERLLESASSTGSARLPEQIQPSESALPSEPTRPSGLALPSELVSEPGLALPSEMRRLLESAPASGSARLPEQAQPSESVSAFSSGPMGVPESALPSESERLLESVPASGSARLPEQTQLSEPTRLPESAPQPEQIQPAEQKIQPAEPTVLPEPVAQVSARVASDPDSDAPAYQSESMPTREAAYQPEPADLATLERAHEHEPVSVGRSAAVSVPAPPAGFAAGGDSVGDRPDRPAQPDRWDQPDRPDQPDQPDQPDRRDQPSRTAQQAGVTASVEETGRRPVPSIERALSGPSMDRNLSWHGTVKIVTGAGAGAAQGPGARDQEALDRNRARLPIGTPKRILVLGCTTGAGQTVTALMTGYMLASLREQAVAAVDLHDGTLARYRAPAAWLDEILAGRPPQVVRQNRPDGLHPTPKPNPARLDVIASHETLGDGDEIKLAVQLNRHYPLTVLDGGPTGLTKMLKVTDQLVLVAPANVEAAGALADTRDWLDAHGHADLAMQSVTVINGVSRRSLPDVEQAESIARGRSRAIVRVPWDDMLPVAATGPSTLRPQTRVAYTALAGVLVAGLAAAQVRTNQ